MWYCGVRPARKWEIVSNSPMLCGGYVKRLLLPLLSSMDLIDRKFTQVQQEHATNLWNDVWTLKESSYVLLAPFSWNNCKGSARLFKNFSFKVAVEYQVSTVTPWELRTTAHFYRRHSRALHCWTNSAFLGRPKRTRRAVDGADAFPVLISVVSVTARTRSRSTHCWTGDGALKTTTGIRAARVT